MSIPVDLGRLAQAMGDYGFAYLLTSSWRAKGCA